MEIILPKTDLVRELYYLQGVVERKSAIPILSNALVEAEGETVRLSATDLDISLKSECVANVVAAGAVTLNARKLYEIARSLPESDVHLAVGDDSRVAIRCEHVAFKIAALPREDFPALPQRKDEGEVEVESEALRDLIGRTAFAMTGEDARYFLSGAMLIVEEGSLVLVATDGHRLSYARRDGAGAKNAAKRVLVPRKAVNELQRLLEDGGTVKVQESGSHLLFTVGRRTLASKMVEGQFPSFDNVVTAKGEKVARVEREAFLAAVRRVSLVAAERTRAVKLTLANGALTLAAASADLGEAHETLTAEYDGEDVTIGFNAQYIQDFLSVVATDSVQIELKNADSQGIFRPAGELPTDHRYIVMPMRL